MWQRGERRPVSARINDILWDAELKAAPYGKQNAGTGTRGAGGEIRITSCIPLLTELCV